MQLKCFALGLIFTSVTLSASIARAGSATDVLFADNFTLTASNPNTTNLNFQISTRESGSLAPITYSDGQEATFSQVGNSGSPNALLLAGQSAWTSGGASPNQNFNQDPGLGKAMVIDFDVNPVLIAPGFNTTATAWIAVDFGSTAAGRTVFPQYTDGIGLLFRGNRQTQAFDDGTGLGDGRFAPTEDTIYHHITIEISNSVTGNPFSGDGTPDLIRAFADYSSVPFFTDVRSTGFTSDYISFVAEGEGSGGDDVVRDDLTNLQVSIQPVPEPGSFLLILTPLLLLVRRSRIQLAS